MIKQFKNISLISVLFFSSSLLALEPSLDAPLTPQKKSTIVTTALDRLTDLGHNLRKKTGAISLNIAKKCESELTRRHSFQENVLLFSLGIAAYYAIRVTLPYDALDTYLHQMLGVCAFTFIMDIFFRMVQNFHDKVAEEQAAKRYPLKKHAHPKALENIQNQRKDYAQNISHQLSHITLGVTNYSVGSLFFIMLWHQAPSHMDIATFLFGHIGLAALAKGSYDINKACTSKNIGNPRNYEYLFTALTFGCLCLFNAYYYYPLNGIAALTHEACNLLEFQKSADYVPGTEINEQAFTLFKALNYQRLQEECSHLVEYMRYEKTAIKQLLGYGTMLSYSMSIAQDIIGKFFRNLNDYTEKWENAQTDNPILISGEKEFLDHIVKKIQETENLDNPYNPYTPYNPGQNESWANINRIEDESMGHFRRKALKSIERENEKRHKKDSKNKETLNPEIEQRPQETPWIPNQETPKKLTPSQAKKLNKLKKLMEEIKGKQSISVEKFQAIENLAVSFGLRDTGRRKSGTQKIVLGSLTTGLHPVHGTNRVERGRLRVLEALSNAIFAEYGAA